MRTSKFLAAVLLVTVGFSALTSCQTDDPQSNYQSMEGVNAITRESSQQYDGMRINILTDFFLYSDSYPITKLENTIAKVYMVSDNKFLLAHADTYTYSDTSHIVADDLFLVKNLPSLIFPQCGLDGVVLRLTHKIMEDGVYDFYIRFENPDHDAYYQTPVYRYELKSDADNWYYNATISEL